MGDGARRRCDQRIRSPAEHHGGGKRVGRASQGGGGCGGRASGRDQGPGDCRVRFFAGRRRGKRSTKGGVADLGGEKRSGSLAKPDDIRFTDSLPKTRSGKIMRRLLRELAAGGEVKGDVTTLEDLGVLAKLRQDED